jgi:AraC-type DNA-binding domain-containing proteins
MSNVLLIAAAVLASRAAISGGLSREIAMTMCDTYIQKAELMSDYHMIAMLNMQMLLDFAERVRQLQCPFLKSELVRSAVQYINANLNRKLTTGFISEELRVSRTYLCKSFAKETGLTMNDYIIQQKICEAKRMLASSTLPIVNISESLAFSSQSYFQNVFKRITGKTPIKFRKGLQ